MTASGRRPDESLRSAALAALVVVSALASAFAVAPAAAAQSGDPVITVDYSGETVTVANGSSQVISGTADVRKGTELTVRVRSAGNTQPAFIKSAEAVVTENGTWAVAFNFSRIEAGGPFNLLVRTENGEHEVQMKGEIVECEGDCTDQPPENTPTPIPEQTPTPEPTASPDPVVIFDKQAISVTRGEVAAISLAFERADTATVVLGGEEVNYKLVATVEDGDGDGEAVLYFDSSLAGRDGRTVSVSGGDSVTVHEEWSLPAMLDAGTYDLSLYAGNGTDGKPTTIGSLILTEAGGESDDDDSDADGGDGSADGNADSNEATTTERPGTESGLSGLPTGLALSVAFVVGGAILGFGLLRG